MPDASLHPPLAAWLDARAAEIGSIPADRRSRLGPLIDHVAEGRRAAEPARLVFICTHNSRRSHMAHLLAAAAAVRAGVEARTFSGGTEATAFEPRAIAALRRTGMDLEVAGDGSNPLVLASLGPGLARIECTSKVHDHPVNPREGFAAVMVCDSADAACPFVAGAERRVALPFEDPKAADDTPDEAATYDARCCEIGRAMVLLMDEAARR